MVYDYSRGFLLKHAETVQKLIQIAQTGEILSYRHEEWEPIRRRHQLINALLANMARNMPDMADIRKVIRCWTKTMPDYFELQVGKPAHKITGRPPGTTMDWEAQYIARSEVSATGKYMHPDTITEFGTDKNYIAFVGKLRGGLNSTYHSATAHFEGVTNLPEAVEWFNDLVEEMGWRVQEITDEGFVTFVRLV